MSGAAPTWTELVDHGSWAAYAGLSTADAPQWSESSPPRGGASPNAPSPKERLHGPVSLHPVSGSLGALRSVASMMPDAISRHEGGRPLSSGVVKRGRPRRVAEKGRSSPATGAGISARGPNPPSAPVYNDTPSALAPASEPIRGAPKSSGFACSRSDAADPQDDAPPATTKPPG